ncbi:MAG: HlyD family efflux transporter periplasmic adaptor subunit [Chitinophagaceae bacterium]|nr:HlyD family efflux transporter periplasmic adaptor subunit [Chitinophagaceae bacterium]
MKRFALVLFCFVTALLSCKHTDSNAVVEESVTEEVQTPVTVTEISTEAMVDYVDLTAISSFLQSSFIKATANGFIKSVSIKPGEFVQAGKQVFVMQTKEAKALGNTINDLDPSFKFSGLIRINVAQSGFISQVNHQPGDYVQDGEQLAVLSNASSFGFLLNLPYELRSSLAANKNIDVELPDKTHLIGHVAYILPTVDSVSQTQAVLIKVNAQSNLPTNLIAKVRIVKNAHANVQSLPKEAILADEAQTNFWVMKMIDSATAVKIDIVKGMEAGDRVEVVSPNFSKTDKFVLKGNYGLPDTAKVKIMKGEE